MEKEKVAYDGRAVWNDSWGRDLSIPGSPADDWRGGGDASGTEISSFAVVDDVLAALGDRSRFPNLRRVVMTGYSAGGQFVGRYVATGKGVVRDGVTLEYVAMTPSTELWLNDNVRWHYGLKDRPRYSEHLTEGQIHANLSSRRVWRGCGTADVKGMPITSLDSCPEAMAQGANRYERFRNFEKYLKRYPSWAKQVSFHAFENLGHQGNVAYADPALIEFISGQGATTVKVSSFGYDSEDSTEFIRKALASGAKKVILDRQAGPWYTLPLKMPSNIEFVLEPGVELVAKRGAFRGIRDKLLELSSVTNVILRGGEGSALRMWKCDYQRPPYEPGEWRNALKIWKGSRNILVENLRMLQSGGDGIGVSGTDIIIRNCVCDGNHRQGMSVFDVENLLVENCVFSNTSGTAPQAGVDLEPDHSYQKLKDIVFRNCVSYDNTGAGFLTCLIQQTGESAPVGITFENCRSWGNRQDAYVAFRTAVGIRQVTGLVRYMNCAFGPSKEAAVRLQSLPGNGFGVRFEDTVLTNSTEGCAVLARWDVPAQKRMDGVDFGNLTVFGDGDWFRCAIPGTGPVTNVTGEIAVISSSGARRIERIDGDWAARNLPVFDGGRPVPGPATLPGLDSVRVEDLCPGELAPTEPVTILSPAPLIFFADKPGICRFVMRQICAVSRFRISTGFLTIAPVEGGKGERFRMPGAEPGEVAYNASRRGFYRIVPPKGMKTRLRIDSTSVPVAIDATRYRVKIAAMKNRPFELQFAAAGEPFAFVAYGDGYYRFGVSVMDANGGQRESDDMVDGLFVAHGEKGDAPGFCKARFCPASQPHFDHIGLSLHGGGGFFFLSGAKKWR